MKRAAQNHTSADGNQISHGDGEFLNRFVLKRFGFLCFLSLSPAVRNREAIGSICLDEAPMTTFRSDSEIVWQCAS